MTAGALSGLFRSVGETMNRMAEEPFIGAVQDSIERLEATLFGGGKVLVFGNGGSAADAQHIAAELVGRYARDRQALPAIALASNAALLTAWSNDHSFSSVFARQIEALGQPGDVAWGISTSGRSPSVVTALQRARELGLQTIGLTGAGGGDLGQHCDVLMAATISETARVQEVHVVTYHAICAALERRACGDSD